MSLKTPASFTVKPLRALPNILSGLIALRGLIFLKQCLNTATVSVSTPMARASGIFTCIHLAEDFIQSDFQERALQSA